MTQEEKELLIKDICARLPYGVKFAITNEKTDTLKSIGIDKFGLIPINLFYKKPSFYLINEFGNIEYKPYLRPMSSMTEEENKEFQQIFEIELKALEGPGGHTIESAASSAFQIDFYNKHHFDYRGLISMGLALEAPENMYAQK